MGISLLSPYHKIILFAIKSVERDGIFRVKDIVKFVNNGDIVFSYGRVHQIITKLVRYGHLKQSIDNSGKILRGCYCLTGKEEGKR